MTNAASADGMKIPTEVNVRSNDLMYIIVCADRLAIDSCRNARNTRVYKHRLPPNNYNMMIKFLFAEVNISKLMRLPSILYL